ncbi:MAG: hypothetical protein CME64_08440 [Halobacteriovoraceae bacterium]|nr:hypothetical protein [Halobacteriovoraceae bacterium]|tara:strand:- start:227075 stop:227287 length:213 start_codon:yes stop_codon:yes gene_type:complete
MKRIKKKSWTEIVAAQKDEAKTYKTSNSFYVGEYIDHKKFGVGYIQDSFGNKVEVLFEDKVRTLIHMVMF